MKMESAPTARGRQYHPMFANMRGFTPPQQALAVSEMF
jgi:hypothetical protein